MDELIEALSRTCKPGVELPLYRRELRRALIAYGKRMGGTRPAGFRLPRPSWRLAAVGLIVPVLIVSLAIGLPLLIKAPKAVLASDIALANPQVKVALSGSIPVTVAVTENFGTASNSRVVIAVPPEQAVIADVDMNTRKVTRVMVQRATEFTEAQVLDAAKTDPRVQEALSKGCEFLFDRVVLLYPEIPGQADLLGSLRRGGVKPEELVGFLGFAGLMNDPESFSDLLIYNVVVNMSLGKVVVFENTKENMPTTPHSSTIVGIPTRTYATPDPGSINGVQPEKSSFKWVEHTATRLKLKEVDQITQRQYATYTWDINQEEIEKILALARTDPKVQELLAKGARFAAITASYGGGGPHEIRWRADVRIDLGEVSYRIKMDYSSRILEPLGDSFLKPKECGRYDIVLP